VNTYFLIGIATPSRGVVTAAVAKALAVTGRAARISAIVRADGYRARVSAPEAGKLTAVGSFAPRQDTTVIQRRSITLKTH
jgi:hypothetical protein